MKYKEKDYFGFIPRGFQRVIKPKKKCTTYKKNGCYFVEGGREKWQLKYLSAVLLALIGVLLRRTIEKPLPRA